MPILESSADTFPKLLLRNSRSAPDCVAMRKKELGIWREYTWGQCAEKVKDFSLGLVSLGLRPRDRVAIIGENEPQWFWAEFATQAAGGIMVGIYTDMVPSEVRYIAKHSGSRFAVAHDQEQVDKFIGIMEELPDLRKVIYWDDKGLSHYSHPFLMSFEEVLELGKKYDELHGGSFEENVARGSGEDIAALYYTSGTTGEPKAAMVSHRALISSGGAFLEFNPCAPEDNFFSYLPAAWIGEGMFVTSSHLLNRVVLNFAEEPETVQEDLREIGPCIVSYGPRQWEDLARTITVRMREARAINRLLYNAFLKVGYKRAQLQDRDLRAGIFWRALIALGDALVFKPLRENFGLKNCRIATTGSAAMSIDTFRFWSALGVRLKQLYGSTEAGFVAGHRSDEIRFETLGNVASIATVRISEGGEILVKGPGTFSGYYEDPGKTAEVMADGWVRTGDAGFVDKRGHLVFLDRLSDLSALSSGARYAPQYIEGRLRFSPYVKDAMVLGGENRGYLSVIVIIDFENVGKWAEERRINYTTFVDLSQKPEVAGLVRSDIKRLNEDLPDEIRIRKFALLHKEFDPDEAELTRTRKLRRGFMERRYADLVEAIYQDRSGVEIKAQVKYRDGREAVVSTKLRVWLVDEEAA
jgi:long-chain acyl-CoA synthetase